MSASRRRRSKRLVINFGRARYRCKHTPANWYHFTCNQNALCLYRSLFAAARYIAPRTALIERDKRVRAARSIKRTGAALLWKKNRISLRIIWLHVWETFIANWRLPGRTRCWKSTPIIGDLYETALAFFAMICAHWNHRRAITFCHPYIGAAALAPQMRSQTDY